MSAMYIPPEGIYFRLFGRDSNNVISSRLDPIPGVYTPTLVKDDDHYFTLVWGVGLREGTFLIKSKATDQFLSSRDHPKPGEPYVGHSTDAVCDDK